MENNIAADEKSTLVMAYTANMLVRGELVTKSIVKVSIWPRSQGVPNLIHILNPSVVLFGGGSPKSFNLSEIFVPTPNLIGFHVALPNNDPLDYDVTEKNRTNLPVSLIMGTFTVKGSIRIATTATLATSLEVMSHGWLSIYDAELTNPFLPQFQNMGTRLLLVNPAHISFFS